MKYLVIILIFCSPMFANANCPTDNVKLFEGKWKGRVTLRAYSTSGKLLSKMFKFGKSMAANIPKNKVVSQVSILNCNQYKVTTAFKKQSPFDYLLTWNEKLEQFEVTEDTENGPSVIGTARPLADDLLVARFYDWETPIKTYDRCDETISLSEAKKDYHFVRTLMCFIEGKPALRLISMQERKKD